MTRDGISTTALGANARRYHRPGLAMRPAQVVPRTSVRLRWLTARTWLAPLLIFSLVFQGLLAQVHIFSHLPFAGGNAGVVANFGATASFTSPPS